MKYVIGITLALGVFASTAIAQTRYFLFPSEVSEFSSQNARAVNLFGIATDYRSFIIFHYHVLGMFYIRLQLSIQALQLDLPHQ